MAPALRILTVAAGSCALVACQNTAPHSTGGVSFTAPLIPGKKQTVSVSPAKARPGAGTVRYSIVEITVPDQGPSELRPLLTNCRKQYVTFNSLQDLSKLHPADVLQSGECREGQTLRLTLGDDMPYPVEFSTNGKPLSRDSKFVGLETTLQGNNRSRDGSAIATRAFVRRTGLLGFVKYPLPSGATVLQPRFEGMNADVNLTIPNHGYVVLTTPTHVETLHVEDLTSGTLKKSTETVRKYLALGVSVERRETGGSVAAN